MNLLMTNETLSISTALCMQHAISSKYALPSNKNFCVTTYTYVYINIKAKKTQIHDSLQHLYLPSWS